MPRPSPRPPTTGVGRTAAVVAAVVAVVVACAGCSMTGPVTAPGADAGADGASPTSAPSTPSTVTTTTVSPTDTPTTSPTSAPASPRTSQATGSPSGSDDGEDALTVLESLEVKGRAPLTGYDRAAYGQAWLDADRNGCDTRNDVLGEQLRDPVFKAGTGQCLVLTGLLEDPYTGAAIPYDSATGDGSGIDVDHVVALGNSWVTGAAQWDVPRLAAFANDPLNLLAVDAGANRAKGAGDAATWLPPQRRAWCVYVARQVAVKAKYALWVTPAEADAARRVLAGCPGQQLPPASGAPTEVSFLAADGGRTTCADLAARGATPVRRGDPDYSSSLDGDGDGVACE